MEKVDIFDQRSWQGSHRMQRHLVVVFNGKKAFWFKEQIESFVKSIPKLLFHSPVFLRSSLESRGELLASTRDCR